MIKIEILDDDGTSEAILFANEGERLSDVLVKAGKAFQTPCNGKGICKQCNIMLLKENGIMLDTPQKILTCQYHLLYPIQIQGIPLQDLNEKISDDFIGKYPKKAISFQKNESSQENKIFQETVSFQENKILQENESSQKNEDSLENAASQKKDSSRGKETLRKVQAMSTCENTKVEAVIKKDDMIQAKLGFEQAVDVAIDIGTTTLAFALVDAQTKEVLAMHSDINPQRIYGLDVISRMKASTEGKKAELKELIWSAIFTNIDKFEQALKRQIKVRRIVVAANTAMLHMLLGESCESLSKEPFEPVFLNYQEKEVKEIVSKADLKYQNSKLCLLPGVSAFVGADIVAGMYALDFVLKDNVLLIDLGTNGEMVLKKKNKILATATAAGPALEAANISCGIAGVVGAIHKVNIMQQKIQTQTIGNAKMKGICGSGVIELVYELQKAGKMDKSGKLLLNEPATFFTLGVSQTGEDIVFTQEDIRQIQMAKAAIRAGMELLMIKAGVKASEIEQVYLAGGLGFALNVFKATGIGLLSPNFRAKTKAVGNTALLGAIRFIQEEDAKERCNFIRQQVEMINLAKVEEFEEFYVKYMNF